MTTRKFIIASLVLAGLGIGIALAEEQAERPKRQWGDQLAKKLNMTEEQAQQVREIFRQHHEQMKSLREQLEQRLGEVLTEEQMSEFRKLRPAPGMQPVGPDGPLQMHPARPAARGMMALRRLDLTDQQKEQVRQIMQDAQEKSAGVDEPKQKHQIKSDSWDKIVKEVLTDEQRTRLDQLKQECKGPDMRGRPKKACPSEPEDQ